MGQIAESPAHREMATTNNLVPINPVTIPAVTLSATLLATTESSPHTVGISNGSVKKGLWF